MGSRIGITKIAAKRSGVSFEKYQLLTKTGYKFCWQCHTWKFKEVFGKDASRADGLEARCLTCRRPRTGKGKEPTKKPLIHQARWAVNHAIAAGRLIKASMLPCFDCGKPAREYDHYRGYERSHWFDVQAVCSSCHKKRTYNK